MKKEKLALVTGAGGFIGHHLTRYLRGRGYRVRGVDIKYPEYEETNANEFIIADLTNPKNAMKVTKGVSEVYQLAAIIGGMGYLSSHNYEILSKNVVINANMVEAALKNKVDTYFYSSSACVYPEYRQLVPDVAGLKEPDAYPADPQDAYGWEKLTAEKLCIHANEDLGLNTHMARFHNVFGPQGTWRGGKEKAPAALCRKVAVAKLCHHPRIEIWGDGEATRSFLYIHDCTRGIYQIAQSDYHGPLNIGSDRMISVNNLAKMIADIAETSVELEHIPGPQGVRGRNSDNELVERVIHWKPEISLEEGLRRTYHWIEENVNHELAKGADPMDLARSVVYS